LEEKSQGVKSINDERAIFSPARLSPSLVRRFKQMQCYSARCNKCQSLLFEVPNFEAFHNKIPVILSCPGGCGSRFTIRPAAKAGIAVTPYGRKKTKIKVLIGASGEA